MNPSNFQNQLLFWAIVLAIGFPILQIALGELIHRLQKNNHPITATIRNIRNLVTPSLAILIFLKKILNLSDDKELVKIVETVFLVCLFYASLSLFVFLFAENRSSDSWQSKVPKLFRELAKFTLVMLGTAVILSAVWKIDLAGLITALGVGSIVLGFALQDSIGSIFSGIMLLFERPFEVGDWLKIGELEGKVVDMNWRSIHLETEDRYHVIIPHLFTSKEIICNYNRPFTIHEQEIPIRFSYEHPPNLVKQVLKATAISTPGVLSHPEPEVETKIYDEYAIVYNVVLYIKDFSEREGISDEFMTRVWYAAKRYNLKIPFPTREIHQVDTSICENATVSKFTKNLQSIPVFVRMETESLENIAQGANIQNFAVGEEVIKEGDRVQALYSILAGKAIMSTTNYAKQKQDLLTLERGEFFGETSLFTGEPSTVSVTAIEDLEVILIYADTANIMIERQPSLAREMGQIMEARRKAINLAKQEAVKTQTTSVS